MSDKTETIVHGRYRYMPDIPGSKYVVVYFETGDSQVIMENADALPILGNPETLGELATNLDGILSTVGKETIMKTYAEFKQEDPVLLKGQFGADVTNHLLKIGDGISQYSELPYYAAPNAYGTRQALKVNNPFLAPGQFCIESDTGRIKMGNGRRTYNELPYYFIPENYVNPDELPDFDLVVSRFLEDLSNLAIVTDTRYSFMTHDTLLKYMQIGYETDTRMTKVGNAVHNYTALPYIVDDTIGTLIEAIEYLEATIEKATPIENHSSGYDKDFIAEDGKLYVEIDSGFCKIGDGVTKWEYLPYACVDVEAVKNAIDDLKALIAAIKPIRVATMAEFYELGVVDDGRVVIVTATGDIYIGDGVTDASELQKINTDESSVDYIIVDAKDHVASMTVSIDGTPVTINPEFIVGSVDIPEDEPDIYFEITG